MQCWFRTSRNLLDIIHPGQPSLRMEGLIRVNDFLPTPLKAGAHKCCLFLVLPGPWRRLPQVCHSKLLVSMVTMLCGDSGIDTLGAFLSSCLLPERIIITIGPFSFCSWHVHKHLLKAPAQVCTVCPHNRKRRRSWSPWEGFNAAAFREEITTLGMCWTHCRDADSAPAVSPHEKIRDLIYLNRFLVCGVVFFF